MSDIPSQPDLAPAPAPAPVPSGAWALLRRGPFARYMAGETVSATGTWMQQMAQGVVMAHLTEHLANSNRMLSYVNLASSLPMLLLTMYGGSVADRRDKRLVLQLTQVVQILLAVLVGWLIYTKQVEIWHILVAAALLGVAAAFEMPAAAALVPELVKKEDISSAIAIDRAIFHGTRTIGPAVAGFLVATHGASTVFFANAFTFMALMAALLTIQPRARGTVEEEQERSSGMKAGVDYVRQDRPTLAMLGLMASASLCVFPFMAVLMPNYALKTLGIGEYYMGWLISVSGIGSFLAAVGMLRVPRPKRPLWMMVGVADVVLSLSGLAMAKTFGWAALALGALALGTSLVYGLANTTVQERAPGPLRGRVSALAALSFVGVMPFAAVGMGSLADVVGIRMSMGLAAAVYGLAGTVIFLGPGRRCTELPVAQAAAVPV